MATHSHPKAPFGPQTARTDCHCTSEKQPANAHHSSLAYFECEVYLCTFVFMVKIKCTGMGNKAGLPRLSHIYHLDN